MNDAIKMKKHTPTQPVKLRQSIVNFKLTNSEFTKLAGIDVSPLTKFINGQLDHTKRHYLLLTIGSS